MASGGKRPGSGRKPGSPNKMASGVKSNVIGVFSKIGGREAMAEWALANQTQFYQIYSKLLPSELSAEVRGSVGADFLAVLAKFWAARDAELSTDQVGVASQQLPIISKDHITH